jgi:hypothetical protein
MKKIIIILLSIIIFNFIVALRSKNETIGKNKKQSVKEDLPETSTLMNSEVELDNSIIEKDNKLSTKYNSFITNAKKYIPSVDDIKTVEYDLENEISQQAPNLITASILVAGGNKLLENGNKVLDNVHKHSTTLRDISQNIVNIGLPEVTGNIGHMVESLGNTVDNFAEHSSRVIDNVTGFAGKALTIPHYAAQAGAKLYDVGSSAFQYISSEEQDISEQKNKDNKKNLPNESSIQTNNDLQNNNDLQRNSSGKQVVMTDKIGKINNVVSISKNIFNTTRDFVFGIKK